MAVAPLNFSVGNFMEFFEQQLAYGRPNLNKWQGPIEKLEDSVHAWIFPVDPFTCEGGELVEQRTSQQL